MRPRLTSTDQARILRCLGAVLTIAMADGSAAAELRAQENSSRVVALGGSVTETVYALGAADRLVGVDQSSVYPVEARSLPDVGYFRSLGTEGVLSLAPDLVLALEGSGPPVVLDQLRAAGVRVVDVPANDTPAGAIEKVRLVATALGLEEEGRALVEELETELSAVRSLAADLPDGPRTLFVWGRGGRAIQVSGTESAAAAMLDLVGATNAVDGFTGYRALTPEAMIVARPEVIIADAALLDRLGGLEGLRRDPALATTPAVRDGRVVPVEVLGFIGFGPRTGTHALEVMKAIHGAEAVEEAAHR